MRCWKLLRGRSNRCWQWSDLGLGSGKLIVELLSIQGRQQGGGIYNRLPWITHFIQLEKIGKYCIGPGACPQQWLCLCVGLYRGAQVPIVYLTQQLVVCFDIVHQRLNYSPCNVIKLLFQSLHLHMQEETSQEEGINKIKKHSGT